MAETMRESKGTTKFINCQYQLVVFFKKHEKNRMKPKSGIFASDSKTH
jgi:hypothetical protein